MNIKYSIEKKQALIEQLKQGPIVVSFTKVNGDRRDMLCTLNATHLPVVTQKDNATQARKENPAVQSVYDVTAKGWRSFRWENVIEYTEVEVEDDKSK